MLSKVTIGLLCDAFGLTVDECLRLADDSSLANLYKGVAGRFGDNLELETLTIELERELCRKLTHDELCSITSVGDLDRLLNMSRGPTEAALNRRRQ